MLREDNEGLASKYQAVVLKYNKLIRDYSTLNK